MKKSRVEVMEIAAHMSLGSRLKPYMRYCYVRQAHLDIPLFSETGSAPGVHADVTTQVALRG